MMLKSYFAAVGILALVLIGCESAPKGTNNATGPQGVFVQATTQSLSATEYRVAPPDKLKIHAPSIKEIENTEVVIRPDGKISLNLLGEVFVSGKTPKEISAELTAAAAQYYINPSVTVDVSEYKSKTYSMFGEVASPGQKPFTGRDCVLSAVASSVLTEGSWPQKVVVSRPARPPQQPAPATVVVDMKHIYLTGDLTQNYMLEEGDILDIPMGPLTQINTNVTKVIGPFTGAAAGASSANQIAHPGSPTP